MQEIPFRTGARMGLRARWFPVLMCVFGNYCRNHSKIGCLGNCVQIGADRGHVTPTLPCLMPCLCTVVIAGQVGSWVQRNVTKFQVNGYDPMST